MRCPFCAATDTRVTDSRLAGDGDQVRRRRQCSQCEARFTTYEKVELSLPAVVKGDGSRQRYDEDKLRTGLLRALHKRPVTREAVEAALSRISRQLSASGEREVPSRQLGEQVMAVLRDLDEVAYVRFASVYRQFEDARAFRDEIERLERVPPAQMKRRQMSLQLPEQQKATAAGKGKGRGRKAAGAAKPVKKSGRRKQQAND